MSDLEAKNPGNIVSRLVKEERDMQKKIPEKAAAVDKLVRQVSGKPNVDQKIDKAVRAALQQARRNNNKLSKQAAGVYLVKSTNESAPVQLVMMRFADADETDLEATYVSESGQAVTEKVASFISKLQ